MHFWWSNKALWELDQIRPILVSHLGNSGRGKREGEKGREEEEEKKYGNHVFVWKLGFCMEVFVWRLVVPFLGFR